MEIEKIHAVLTWTVFRVILHQSPFSSEQRELLQDICKWSLYQWAFDHGDMIEPFVVAVQSCGQKVEMDDIVKRINYILTPYNIPQIDDRNLLDNTCVALLDHWYI